MNKWANELNRAFSMKEIQMAKKHIKQCSTFLTIKEMKFKTTLRFLLTPVRMATIKKTSNVDEDVEVKEFSSTVGRNTN
jgi:hypothetical protein